nr:unnamed protein product [Callosobruchus chinensis]
MENKRTSADIKEILRLAKLQLDDLKSTSQTIYFTKNNLYENDLKLLQLDATLLGEVSEGKKLYIKGDDNEEVVICSETQTYQVTEAETSNSLLLVDNLILTDPENTSNDEYNVNEVTVHSIFYNYLEAIPIKPHLKKLRHLLNESIYKGPEYESEVDPTKCYTFEQLDEMVQASTKELRKALDDMDVVLVNNKIRLLDFEYHFKVLSYMLKLIDENSWQLDEIDYQETVDALKDLVPKEILTGLFETYTEESQIIDGIQLYRYKEDKVCIFFAKVLLYGAGKFNLNDFLQAWKESVPDGMSPAEDMVYGIAVIEIRGGQNPDVIRAFDESELPENLTERFKVLFEVKEKWTVAEIAPYIKPLTTDKLDVSALLAKYARASKIDGVKYYSSKHGV